jgi:hypothetical protein
MNPTDSTHPANTDPQIPDPVSIAEIADFLRHLRSLSRRPASGSDPSDPVRDDSETATAERAAFLTRKADLFARIAAHHPDLTPPTTAPPTTAPPTAAHSDRDPA